MRNVVLTILLIAALALAAYSINVILIGFAGILLGILLRTAADWIHGRTGLGCGLCLFLVVVVLVAIFVANIWLFGVNVAAQIDQLSAAAEKGKGAVMSWLQQYAWGRRALAVGTDGNKMMSGAQSAVSGMIHFIAAMVLMIVVAIYTAAAPTLYVCGFVKLLPQKHRAEGAEILGEIGDALRWWLLGQMISMSVVGVATAVGLWALGVPLPFTLGFITAVLNFIPNIGAISSAAFAAILALTVSGWTALYVLALFVVIQGFEAYFLTPMIQQRAVELPPALTIMVQAFMGVAVGGLGIALGAPLTVVGLVLTKRLRFSEKIPPASGAARPPTPIRHLRT